MEFLTDALIIHSLIFESHGVLDRTGMAISNKLRSLPHHIRKRLFRH
jgi:hypothetical protein